MMWVPSFVRRWEYFRSDSFGYSNFLIGTISFISAVSQHKLFLVFKNKKVKNKNPEIDTSTCLCSPFPLMTEAVPDQGASAMVD